MSSFSFLAKLHKKWCVSHLFLKQLYPPPSFWQAFFIFFTFRLYSSFMNYIYNLINLHSADRKSYRTGVSFPRHIYKDGHAARQSATFPPRQSAPLHSRSHIVPYTPQFLPPLPSLRKDSQNSWRPPPPHWRRPAGTLLHLPRSQYRPCL